jgi:MFS family permease
VVIGAVFSATPLGYGVATVLGGRLADHVPPRRLCWAAVALLVAGFAAAFIFPSPATFVAGYSFVGLGLGGGIALTGALAATAQAFPRRVGSMGGLLTGTYASGAVVQVPIVQYLAPTHYWVDILRMVGTALALLAIASVLLMPSLPAPVHAATHDRAPLVSVFRRPRILTGFVIELLATPVGAYTFVNAGVYALGLGLGGAVAAAALVAAAIGNASGRLGGGVLADAIGSDRVLAGICVCELAAALLVVTGSPLGVVLGSFGCGFALGGAAGAMARIAADGAPDAPHSAFGLLFAGFAGGVLAGPLLGAALGQGNLPWLALGLLAIPGMAATLARRGLPSAAPLPGPAREPRT